MDLINNSIEAIITDSEYLTCINRFCIGNVKFYPRLIKGKTTSFLQIC